MTAESNDMQQMAAEVGPARADMESGALDLWLHQELAARFDSTLNETLPPELTVLLSGLH